MAVAYLGLRKYAEAVRAAEEAIRLKPDYQLAKNNLAWIQREQANPTAPPTPAATLLSDSLKHAQAGRFKECVDAARQSAKLDPKSSRAFNNAGFCAGNLKLWGRGGPKTCGRPSGWIRTTSSPRTISPGSSSRRRGRSRSNGQFSSDSRARATRVVSASCAASAISRILFHCGSASPGLPALSSAFASCRVARNEPGSAPTRRGTVRPPRLARARVQRIEAGVHERLHVECNAEPFEMVREDSAGAGTGHDVRWIEHQFHDPVPSAPMSR
jgi:hypothetical protein